MGDMDSGNSGSFQSSSGGDEDYESSRGGAAPDSFSTLLNNHQSNYPAVGHVSTSLNPAASAFFDPLASYFDHLSRSTNLDPVWPKDSMLNLPSSSSVSAAFDSPHPSSTSAPADPHNNQTTGGGGAVRNPKKRTRASRKAPTTVLTTDTTNFRAMVQEFTGIPAPPFTGGGGSLFLPRTRLDLFGGRMDALATSNSLSPYLLRPLAHKIPHPPPTQFLSTNKNETHDVLASSSAGANYHIPDLGLFATDVTTNLSFGSDLVSSKPGSAAALQLPITTTARNDEVRDDLGGITASFFPARDGVSSSSGKNDGGGGGGGPMGWAEGLGLAADAAAPAHTTTPGSRHSHHRPHNLGFSHP